MKFQISNFPASAGSRKRRDKFQIKKTLYSKPWTLYPNKGQIVLLLVLVTVVGLTVGLTLVSRTITDIKISTQVEESSRAFSAAEAGVESALKNAEIGGPSTGNVTLPGASGEYSITTLGNSNAAFIFDNTSASQTQTLWLANHSSTGSLDLTNTYSVSSSLDICWGSDPNAPNYPPAIVMTLWYEDGGLYKIAKAAFDPNPAAPGHNANSFSPAGSALATDCGGGFAYKHAISSFTGEFAISASSKLIALRLTPVYSDTKIGVKPSATLQTQGNQIISQGKTSTGILRKISVFQGFLTLPEVFDYTFFSEN